jgi:hypothetical protein
MDGFRRFFKKTYNPPIFRIEYLREKKGDIKVKKITALLLAILCGASLLIVFPQTAFGQSENLKVLSYSWYTSQYSGNFIVVGELQNTGPDTFRSAIITGTVFTTDNQPQATPARALIMLAEKGALLPNQKVPFYMEFSPETSTSGNLTWVTQGVDRVEFNLYGTTNNTAPAPYSDLQILQEINFLQGDNYTVTGVLRNTGSLYPEKVWVVATFYDGPDGTGKVVAAGFSNFVTPRFLPPNETATFILTPYDATSQMATKIASYSLQILYEGSTAQPTPSPSSTASPTASSSPSTSSSPGTSASNPPNGEPSVPLSTVYAIIAAFVIAAAVIALALFLRRKPKNTGK